MVRNRRLLTAIAAAVTAACLVSSSADARDRHGYAHHAYRYFGNAYSHASWFAPTYRYSPRYGYPPRYEYEVPFYGRIDSNLNPDRQMVGIND